MIPAVVAIDGPAGSGKSTTARAVARALGFAHLDSGALYRALTLAVLDAGIPLGADRVIGLAGSLPVRLALVNQVFRPEVAGVDASSDIRSDRVTGRVSEIAAMPGVRAWVNQELRAAAARHPRGVVVDGRDIGTVVFPDAGLKIYLTASARERAQRRARQSGQSAGPEARAELERVQRELAERDRLDSTRAVAPLPLSPAETAPGSVLLDTTDRSFGDQVAEIVDLARKVFG